MRCERAELAYLRADREALSRLYDEDRLRAFQQFGSLTGYRVGIDGAGAWMFFVAGD